MKDRRHLRVRRQIRGAPRNPERIGHSEDHSSSTCGILFQRRHLLKGPAITSQFQLCRSSGSCRSIHSLTSLRAVFERKSPELPAEIDLVALIRSMDVETICERTGLAFSEQSTIRRIFPSVTDNSSRLPRRDRLAEGENPRGQRTLKTQPLDPWIAFKPFRVIGAGPRSCAIAS